MPSIETRLDRLRLVYRRPAPRTGPSSFDATRLTMREQAELAGLLAPLAPLPGERWRLDALGDDDLERSAELVRKAEGRAPEPAYFGMRHRDPGIGPRRCAGCDRKPTPADPDDRPEPAA